ncbi:hypothetical protein D4R86_03410 [bacterium]|nr:MAG: hypothetical protein D4R86_03410 [bacterium]
MERQFPESSIVNDPHKIEGPMTEAKESFYELAKDKVRYLSHDEIQEWNKETRGIDRYVSPASYILNYGTKISEEGDYEKWVNNLEIVVDRDAFEIDDKDFSGLIPFILEHDIYEAWLSVKKGAASSFDVSKKHLLSLRREFLLAAEQCLEDKLFEWHILMRSDDEHKQECEHALDYAKRRANK